MSMTLDESKPAGLTAKTCGVQFKVGTEGDERFEQVVMVGDYEISMADFCTLVDYVFTNTDLDFPDDPRIKLVERIHKAEMVRGYNAVAGINPQSLRYEIL